MEKAGIMEYSYLLALLKYCFKEKLVSKDEYRRIFESINKEYGIKCLP
jgi:hypothetical protein